MASLANTAWFDLYQDDVLRELIRMALASNPDLGVALARIDEARALAHAAGAEINPRVDFAAAGGWARASRVEVPFGDRDGGRIRASFDLAWELDVFGRIRSQAAAAYAAYLGSAAAHRDVGIRLVAEVARAYFELRDLDERLEIATRTLASRQEYVDLAKVRFEGHITSELDWRQAESEFYRTRAVQVEIQRAIAVKEDEIAVLLGRPPGAIARGRRAKEQPLPAAVPAGLPSDLLRRRPDIVAADQALAAETALVGAARANLYPRIALTGSYGWESDQLSELFTSPSNTASLIAGLLQPIFDSGRNRDFVAAQCARMRAAMEAYRGTVLFAFAEVEDGLANYRHYTEQRVVQGQRVAALSRVLELSETRYEGGVAEYLEVLDAQRELFDAELEQAATVQAQLVSLTRLYKALGGGWTLAETGPCLPPSPPSPPAPVVHAPSGLPPSATARPAPPPAARPAAPALVVPPPPPPPPLPR